jgi:tripartite-type tricarboxylate transporter receptor subunit TctC
MRNPDRPLSLAAPRMSSPAGDSSIRRRALLGVATLVAALAAGFGVAPSIAAADDYPTRAIKLVVPYPPGAATDGISRAFAQELSRLLGQSVVVENRAGGGSAVGIATVKSQPADGYTLLVHAEGFYSAKIATPTLGYEFSDFEILAPLAQSSYALIVPADRGWMRLEDLKGVSREIDFGTIDLGVGVYSMMASRTAEGMGIKYRTIPFKGGAEGLTAIVSGQIDAYFTTLGTTQSVKDNPKVKVLASTNRLGSDNFLPGVKTFQEHGVPNLVVNSSYSLAVRAETPAPIRDRIAHAASQAVASDAMKTARRRLYLEAYGGSLEDYRRDQDRIRKDFETAAALMPR